MTTDDTPRRQAEPATDEPTAVADDTARRATRAPAGELLSALSALLLLAVMFATKWYGVVALPDGAQRSGTQSASSAWNQLSDVRWMMLLTVLVTLGSVAIHVTQRSHGSQSDTSVVITFVAAITAALLVYRVLIALPAPRDIVDAKIGAYLGLLAAVGVTIGGFESRRAQRLARRRRQQGPRRHRPVATPPPAR
jgi:hypothetical protein